MKIDGWKALVDLDIELDSTGQEWIFRGESWSEEDRLKTTLERACEDFELVGDQISWIERSLMEDFERHCHLYSPSVLPDRGDTFDWFALARHYGVPSRLLDFTYSLYIATYFAAEMAKKSEAVVWAVNKTSLAQHVSEVINSLPDGKTLDEAWRNREGSVFRKLMVNREPRADFIALINPFKLNDRLALQQGLFLAYSDVTVPFSTALNAVSGGSKDIVRMYRISSQDARRQILVRLYRTGVTRAALFPGLEGYAQSLRSKMLTLRRWGEVQDKWPGPHKGG